MESAVEQGGHGSGSAAKVEGGTGACAGEIKVGKKDGHK